MEKSLKATYFICLIISCLFFLGLIYWDSSDSEGFPPLPEDIEHSDLVQSLLVMNSSRPQRNCLVEYSENSTTLDISLEDVQRLTNDALNACVKNNFPSATCSGFGAKLYYYCPRTLFPYKPVLK